MDFRFTEEQDALRELAREILENEISPERLKQSEAAGEFFDREAWARLAESNLLGLAVPEAQGGMGMGFLELCILLVEVGRTVAPLPVLPTLVYGALPIARFGNEAQRDRWLPPVAKRENQEAPPYPSTGSGETAGNPRPCRRRPADIAGSSGRDARP